jgi:hypothetical protein
VESRVFANSAQSQEQVHTVAARGRTSVNRSCINSQDALTGAQITPKALGDLLCNVNIVWFRVHIRLPVKLAVSTSTLMVKFARLVARFQRAYNASTMIIPWIPRKSPDSFVHSHSGALSVVHSDQHAFTTNFINALRLHLLLLSRQLSEAGRYR